MKVLLINTLYPPDQVGGAERSVQLLAESLVRAGRSVTVVALRPDSGRAVEEQNGVRVLRTGLRNLYWPFGIGEASAPMRGLWHALDSHNLLMAEECASIIRSEKPDLVHTHNLTGFSTAVWSAAGGRPVVHTLRDYYLLCPKTTMFREGSDCERPCVGCSIYRPSRRRDRPVDAVIGISRFVLDRHLGLDCFQNTKIREVIRNSAEPHPQERSRSDRLRFGFLGRMDDAKGYPLLLKAVQAESACELKVAGRGAGTDHPRVHCLGFVDPDELFATIDMLVVPSLWQEPSGRSAIEALSRGLPVIVSDRGGLPELVQDGVTGLVCRPEDLAQTLGRCIREKGLVERLARGARTAAGRFETDSPARAHLQVYERLTRGAS